jgi:hypothetical protein
MQVDSKPTASPLSRETGSEKQRSLSRGGGAGVGEHRVAVVSVAGRSPRGAVTKSPSSGLWPPCPRGGRTRCKSTQNRQRLPSPARPALRNRDRSVAGEGRGWGNIEWLLSRLRVVRREARLRKAPHPAFGHLTPGGKDPMQVDSKPTASPLSRVTGLEKQRSLSRGGGAGVGEHRVAVTGPVPPPLSGPNET